MTARRTLTLLACLLLPVAVRAASALSPHDRAVVIISRHLLTAIGSPSLRRDAAGHSLRSDAYWQAVFQAAHAPELFPVIAEDLHRAINDVPLVGGAPAEPDVFARAVLRGIGPMPMKPLDDAPASEREEILDFARRELAAFARAAYEHPDTAGPAAIAAGARAREVFHSKAVGDAVAQLGRLLGSDDNSRIDLADTKDRLDEYLHPYGLHLVLDAAEYAAGRAKLSSYVILSRHVYNVLGKPFTVYEARPAVDGPMTAELGHAEVEPGYMFIFANHVDKEAEAGLAFASGESIGRLWTAASGAAPLAGLSPATREAVEKEVRERLREGTGLVAANYRALLVDSIGRHEGFHMYVEPEIELGIRRGNISRGVAGSWHENGAYLYQLEAGDPRFVSMDLLMILMLAMDGDPSYPDNSTGAQAVMNDLQQYIRGIRFWDPAEHKPIESGLIALFRLPPGEISKAASQARWDYEVAIQN